MVTKEEVRAAAREFLEAVAEAAKAKLGPRPERQQRSMWMVRTEPSSWSSKEFERMTFDRERVDWFFQIDMLRGDFPQKQRLEEILADAGVDHSQIPYGYFLRLVSYWLESSDPFSFEEEATRLVLDEFAEAIVNKEVITRSRDAIEWLDLASGALTLEDGISLCPITEDELWELGDSSSREGMFLGQRLWPSMPSAEWKILRLEMRDRIGERTQIGVIREAVLVALQLSSPGYVRLVPLRQEYGYGTIRFMLPGGYRSRDLGRTQKPYMLDERVAQRLKSSWPRLRQIMESQGHYLRLPASRLVDGGERERAQDAIIDYAIGLEALLTGGIRDELKYRFSLRGAMVLAWEGGDKLEHFRRLEKFYDVRSDIIHGGRVSEIDFGTMRAAGEDALRKAWWWFFEKNTPILAEATKLVDDRILRANNPL